MPNDFVVIGQLGAAHGVRGWNKVNSFTQPKENIFQYTPWYLETKQGYEKASFTPNADGYLVKLADCDDRDIAQTHTGRHIAITRDMLPEAEDGEYYWSDLVGLTVITEKGETLGTVDHLIETGANDVMIVHGEEQHLIPFMMNEVVVSVDLNAKQIVVSWEIND
jgi:16S rRNA processing protein RimM